MSDADLISLYSGRILALAADIPLNERLPNPQASIKRRAPLCGSMVTVDLTVQDGRITEFGQDVKACALGQAAASIVGAHVVGCTQAEISAARDALKAMLTSGGPVPDAPFDGFEVLVPARGFKNRHASIMLSLDATCEAFALATNADCA